jgi:hypothetical protein
MVLIKFCINKNTVFWNVTPWNLEGICYVLKLYTVHGIIQFADYPCADYPTCCLCVCDRELLTANYEGGK